MSRLAVVAIAALVGSASSLPKDRAAIMYYTGSDSVISFVQSPDSANLALILLTQWQGDSVPAARLSGRPCLGVALFSHIEMGKLRAAGRRPEDVRPRDAALRIRIYAKAKSGPLAVQNLQTGTAYEAIGIDGELYRKAGVPESPLKGSVDRRLADMRTCDAR